MFCPDCGSPITNESAFCPSCGKALAAQEAPQAPVEEAPAANFSEQAQPQAEAAPAEPIAEEAPAEPVAEEIPAEEAPAEEIPVEEPFNQPSFEDAPVVSKGAGLKKFIPIIAAVAAVLALIVLFAGRLPGFFVKTFGSDESYMQYVEKKEFQSLTGDAAHVYGEMIDSYSEKDAVEAKIKLKVSEDALDMLGDYVPEDVDLEWINDVELSIRANMKDELMEGAAVLELDGKTLLDLVAYLDAENQSAFVSILNLTDKYLGIDDIPDLEGFTESQELSDKVIKALPSEKKMDKLLSKYVEIVFENIEEVEKSSDKIKVGGITQKVTSLEYTIDTQTITNIAKAILEEAKTDKELKGIIEDVAKVLEAEEMLPEEAGDPYELFLEAIDAALEMIDAEEIENVELVTLITYVDGSHEVVGREIEVGGEEVFSILTASKGKKFERKLECAGVVLSGEGTKSGSKETAEYTLKVEGEAMVKISLVDFDTEAVANDSFNGKIVIEPTGNLMGSAMGVDGMAAAAMNTFDFGISIEGSGTKDKSEITLGLISKDEALVEIIISTKTENAKKVSLPKDKNVIDVEDANEWLETLDFDKLVKTLKKTDLPDELIDAVEDAVDMMG